MAKSSGADRISDLPPFILHQILSYLPIEDSVRISVVSKYWNYTHKSFPILKFNQELYMSDLDSSNQIHSSEFHTRLTEFLSSIFRSLQFFFRNDLAIQALDISDMYHIPRSRKPLINTWILLALRQGVSELTFGLHVNPEKFGAKVKPYKLRQLAFSLNGPSEFLNLRKLTFCNVVISKRIIQDLTRNFPNIRELVLAGIHGMKNLEISGLQRLESFGIEFCTESSEIETILVDAPSLKSFSALERSKGMRVCPIDLRSCSALASLNLNSCSVTDNELRCFVARFTLLEVIELSHCDKLRRLSIDLPRLQRLEICHCRNIEFVHIEASTTGQLIPKGMGSFTLTRNLNTGKS